MEVVVMASNSKIEWTTHTFNPWSGCSKVHAGCAHCYAEMNYSVKMRGVKWGPNGTRVKTANWNDPTKWNRAAEKAGERHRVFCASLADVFEDWSGPILDHNGKQLWHNGSGGYDAAEFSYYTAVTMNDLRRDLFALIDATPNLDWLLLTKRPENIRRMWRATHWEVPPSERFAKHFRPNVWLGTSISDQATADQYVPELLKCRDLASVLFLSAEPLLGPIRLHPVIDKSGEFKNHQGINCDWVIVGGESGPGARPCRGEWVESIISQCAAAGVPCFVKQMGGNHWYDSPEFGGRQVPLEDAKGGDWSEWPEAWRVRQFPNVEGATQ